MRSVQGSARMGTIRRSELDGAVRGGILSAAQADRLVAFLEADVTQPSGAAGPRFSFVHVLYYLGGMIAIGAMSIFMTLGWNALGGWGGFVTAVLYAVLALSLTHWFLARKQLEIPAGITATLAVVMVPLAIFGAQMALAFWGGLSLMKSGSELGKLGYCGINVAMILLGAVIGRRVFAVFGGLGVAGYLGYLSYEVFKDSMIFPLALSLVGLAIIGLGVLWQRREARWSARLRGFLPDPLRELIEARGVR